jgi:hypothetical protein
MREAEVWHRLRGQGRVPSPLPAACFNTNVLATLSASASATLSQALKADFRQAIITLGLAAAALALVVCRHDADIDTLGDEGRRPQTAC